MKLDDVYSLAATAAFLGFKKIKTHFKYSIAF